MVAIFTGRTLGLETGSAAVLGDRGLTGFVGNPLLGRAGEGVQVNAYTGDLVLQRQDEFLVGKGLDAAFVQTYNSLSQSSGVPADENGDRWRQNYDRRVYGGVFATNATPTTGSQVFRVAGDGAEVAYTWNGSKFVATDGAGSHDTLEHVGATWVWTNGDTQAEEVYYDSTVTPAALAGKLASQSDADGNTILLTYETNGNRLLTIQTAGYLTDAGGANVLDGSGNPIPLGTITLSYNSGTNDVAKIVTKYVNLGVAGTPQQTQVSTWYDYDTSTAQHRLTAIKTDLTPGDLSIADGATYNINYTYDASGRITGITQTDGSSLTISYDVSGRVYQLTQAVASGVSRTTTLTYAQSDANGTYTKVTDAAGQDTKLYYATTGSNIGNLTRVTMPPAVTGATAQTVQFFYDANGNVTQYIDAQGRSTSWTAYDANGNWLTRVSPGANSGTTTVTRTYGANNELKTETTKASDDTTAYGVSATHTTRYVYDAEWHLRYTIGALGEVRKFQYNAAGQLANEVAYPEHTYDLTGLAATDSPTEAQMSAWVNGLADRSSTEISAYTYDQRGALLTSIDYRAASTGGAASTANGTTQHTYVYDQEGRLVSKVDGDPAAPVQQTATTYVYDGLGRVISTTGADGGVTTVSFQDKSSTTVVKLASGLVQTSVYNLSGELIAEVDSQGNLEPDLANASQWSLSNTTSAATTAIGGKAAYLYTVTSGGTSGTVSGSQQAVNAGDVVVFEMTLKAGGGTTGNTNSRIAIVGTTTGMWGVNGDSTATIVNGPGTLVQAAGSLFDISGLSTTTETRVRIVRRFAAADSVKPSVWVGNSGTGAVANDTVILSAPSFERSPGYLYDKLGRLRVTFDHSGNVSYALYDSAGRKTGVVADDGSLVEYKYDAGNHVIATVRYATRVTAANLTALLDPNTALGIADIRPVDAAGDEWSWNVYDTAGRVVQTIGGDGADKRFEYDESGNLIRQTEYFDRFNAATVAGFKSALPTVIVGISATNSDWTYVGAYNQTRSFYDQQGRLIGTMDRYGALTEIVYDESGRKIDQIQYEKLAAGTFTNAQGVSVTRYATSLVDIRANIISQGGNDRHTRSIYDGQLLRYVVDALGYVTQYDYDTTGAGTTTTRYLNPLPGTTTDYTFDAVKAQLSTLASSTSDRKTYSVLNAKGQVAYTIDAENGVTGFAYDTSGHLIRSTQYSTPWTPTASRLVTDLDAWAAPAAIGTAADNRVARSFYDARGQLVYTVDSEGFVTETAYDENGRVTAITSYNTAISGLADTSTIATVASKVAADKTALAYAQTRSTYDALGRVSDSTDAVGTVTHFDYLATGEVWKQTVAYGTADAVVTKYTYDSAGRVLSKTEAFGAAEATTTSYSYDGLGNVISTTDPRGNTTYSYYDVMGRLSFTRDAEDYVTKTSYSNFSEVASVTRYVTRTTSAVTVTPTVTAVTGQDAATSFVYDKLGRLLKTTDAEGKFESQTYNAFGEIGTKTNKLGGTTSYTYDERGLLLSETMAMTSVDRTGTQQAATVTNTYAYNAFGNRTAMVEAAGLTEARTTSYGYDRNGRLVSVSGTSVPVLYGNATGAPSEGTAITKTVTSYDARGNVIETAVKVTTYNSVGTLLSTDVAQSRTLAWYDKLGRKTDELTAGTLITKGTLSHWVYDARGNVSSTSVYGDEVTIAATRPATVPAAVNGANVRTTSYAYDKLDRLKSTSIASVLVGSFSGSAYQYQTKTVTTTNYYDAAGNLIRQTDGRNDNTYFYYDKLSRKTAQVDRESYLTTWTVDEDGNIVDEVRYANKVVGTVTTAAPPEVKAPGSTPLPAVYLITEANNDRATHFTYNRMGWRLTEERAGVLASTVVGAGTDSAYVTSVITYTYNALGEVLSKREATGDTTAYTYDTMGRMTKETDASQPVSGSATAQTPVTQFWYDGLGNLTRSNENGRIAQYEYYASGKLKALTNADGVVRTYYYDGVGNKVAEKYLRTATATIYDAMTYAYDAAGRLTTQGYSTVNGTTWAKASSSDTTQVAYSAYGEVIGRGMNLTSAQITAGGYQDKFDYDNAGHLWRTTAGDGTVNLYVYDENGNQTLDITSSGKDKLASTDTTTTDALPNSYVWANPGTGQTQLDLTAALNLLTNSGANAVGAAVVQGMIVTQSLYDGRNQLTQTRMPMRDRTSLGTYSSSPYTNRKSYNAFGEVTSETDARGNVTNYSYNMLGKVINRELPTVNWTSENGTISSSRPYDYYFYDVSGRLVGVQDANGNVNTRTLLAGTGYGKDSEALVLKEYHADGGIFERQYDLHHDLKVTINEVGKTETYVYDALGQLIEQDHQIRAAGSPGNDLTGAVAVQLKDYYDYDNLGHRTLHTNSQLGSTVKETTAYDIQGRVTSQVDLGGDTTSYSYTWDGSLVTSGLGVFGGWSKVTTNSSGKTRTDKTDYYGRTIDMIDYGGHNYDYTFDLSGRLVGRLSSQGESITWLYYNTGMMQSQVSSYGTTYYGSTITATYQYDADNHRTFEGYDATTNTINWYTGTTYNNVVHHQHANVTWDAAGRMTQFKDTGDQGSAPVQIDWEYDLNGNIRHMAASYRTINDQGVVSTTASTQDAWYRYDAMNRFVTSQGMLAVVDSAGVIQKNASGQNLVGSLARGNAGATIRINYYDPSLVGTGMNAVGTAGAGQGREVLWSQSGDRQQAKSYFYKWETDRYGAQGQPRPDLWTEIVTTENYTYSDDGYLASAAINGTTKSRFMRDAMGRVTDYREYGAGGYVSTNPATNVVYQRTASYNNKGLVTSDVVTSVQGFDTFVNSTTYYYNANETSAGSGQWKGSTAGATYMGGAVTLSSTSVTKNGAAQTGNSTTNTFAWWGSAMQAVTNYDSGSTHNTSTFYYDQSGHLQSVNIQDGRPRTISFVTDVNGQILTRDENDNNTTQGDPKELHYYFNGMGVGDISNNGTSDVDYATSIARHTETSAGYGAFRNGAVNGTSYADFDQSYDPINGLNYASTSSRYTVQGGDTLTSIAQAVWGDASFWYMIADANGLDGTEALAAGQTLILPNKVHNSHNNTSTYRVYDPNEAIGDTAPTAVAPPKQGGGCGFFGQIIMLLITAVVTTFLPPIGGAIGGAIGGGFGTAVGVGIQAGLVSAVSQGIGVAVGVRDSFSWGDVAMTALTAGVGEGLDKLGVFKGIGISGGSFGAKVARGALSSAVTQGIAVATGLQKSFDFGAVAAAGLTAGVVSEVGKFASSKLHLDLSKNSRGFFNNGLEGALGTFIVGGAGAIAGAATRSVINGTDFGDNIMAALPDVIANTIGNLVAEQVSGGGKPRFDSRRAESDLSSTMASLAEEAKVTSAQISAQARAGNQAMMLELAGQGATEFSLVGGSSVSSSGNSMAGRLQLVTRSAASLFDAVNANNDLIVSVKLQGGRLSDYVGSFAKNADAANYFGGVPSLFSKMRSGQYVTLGDVFAIEGSTISSDSASYGDFLNFKGIDDVQIGLNWGAALIAPGAGGSAQASAVFNMSDVGGDNGLIGTIQVAGGSGHGAFIGVGPGAQVGITNSVPQHVFSISTSKYIELDAGYAYAGSLNATRDDAGNWSAGGAAGRAGFAGAGGFSGEQGSIQITLTPNSIKNVPSDLYWIYRRIVGQK